MAETMTRGVGRSVTLATTVTRLTTPSLPSARSLLLVKATTCAVIYVVTDPATADGGGLPATGRIAIPATALPIEVDVAAYGTLGLAGDVAGSVEAVLR